MKTLAIRLSRILSWVLHPMVLPIYLVMLLFSQTAFALFSPAVKWYLCGSVVLYGTLLPMLSVGLMRMRGWLTNLHLYDRRERIVPLLCGAACYLLAATTIGRVDQALFLRKFMLAAACCELFCAVVSTRWQISLHLTAMGAAVALLVVMNVLGIPRMLLPLLWTILAAGALGSARLALGRHTPLELGAGFAGGFALTLFAMFVLK